MKITVADLTSYTVKPNKPLVSAKTKLNLSPKFKDPKLRLNDQMTFQEPTHNLLVQNT